MCIQFLTGMAWTSLYYRKGMVAINREWSYPYFYAPLIIDLTSIVSLVYKKKLDIENYKTFDGMLEYNVVHQLLCIIPPLSDELVPKEVLPLYYPQSPIIDQFPEKFQLDRDGKSQEWMMHALVPHANIRRIYEVMEFVNKTFSRRTIRKYEPDIDFVYPKRGFDPRNTVIQIRRTEDQILSRSKATLGKWGRKDEIKREKADRRSKTRDLSNIEVNIDEFRIQPRVKITGLDPNLRPLKQRIERGNVKEIHFNPKGLLTRVKAEKGSKPTHKPTIREIMEKFENIDYTQFPLNLDI